MPIAQDDPRVSSPIATRSEVSRLVNESPQALSRWTQKAARGPLVHTVRDAHTRFTFPLVGIAQASVVAAFLESGLSMRNIRSAVQRLQDESGDPFVLASPELVTDGTDTFLLDAEGLTRLKDRQQAIHEVLRQHLKPLKVDSRGYVEAFVVERFASEVTIDPMFNAGAMSFTRSRMPLYAPAGAIKAGERPRDVAEDFDLTEVELGDVQANLEWILSFV